MGVFQEVLSDQRFKISLVHLLSQGSEGLSELEVDKGSRVVVQPCVQGAQSVDQSLGIEAVIGLPVLELKAVDAGKKRALVQSLVGDLSQRLLDGRDKLFFLFGIRILGRHRVAGLPDAEFQKGVNFFSDSLVSERFFDRGAFRVAEHVVDDLEGQVQLGIQSVGRQGDIPGQVAAPLQFLLGLHGVVLESLGGLVEGRLKADLRVDFQPVKMRQIGLVQIGQPLLHIHVAVQVNVAVGRMIISSVKIQIGLISQIRNIDRVAAGLHGISCVRIERTVNTARQNIVRRRESPLHLVVDHAVHRDGAVRILCLVVPAFLAEYILLFIDIGIEYCVQIHVHQILEIRVVAACNRIDRLVRIGHGVEKSVQGSLYKFNKGVLDREIPRSAQHGVLNDMRHAGGIFRGRSKCDVEDFVVIL